jgi:hypothetical protein
MMWSVDGDVVRRTEVSSFVASNRVGFHLIVKDIQGNLLLDDQTEQTSSIESWCNIARQSFFGDAEEMNPQ